MKPTICLRSVCEMPGTRLSTIRSSSFCSGKPMCRCRQRRFSASPRSRSLFEVRITVGAATATTVPSSGIVTWKSLRISSSSDLNSASDLSISSISSTQPAGLLQRLQQRPRLDEFLGEEHVAEIVQLVQRRIAASARRRALRRACPSGSACRAAAWRISTHRAPWPRPVPHSIAGGSASGRAMRRSLSQARSCRRRPGLRPGSAFRSAAPR